jgi:hypothetical protein
MPRLTKLFMRRTEGQFVAVFRSIFVANTRARRNNRPGDLSDYLSWKKNTCEQWVQIYGELILPSCRSLQTKNCRCQSLSS